MKTIKIDITPSWQQAMCAYFYALEGTKGNGRIVYNTIYKNLKSEVMRLAVAYDATKKKAKVVKCSK